MLVQSLPVGYLEYEHGAQVKYIEDWGMEDWVKLILLRSTGEEADVSKPY